MSIPHLSWNSCKIDGKDGIIPWICIVVGWLCNVMFFSPNSISIQLVMNKITIGTI